MGFISLFKVHQLCLFCQKAKCSLGLSYNLPTCFSKTALQFLLQMSSVYKECHRNRMPKKKKKKKQNAISFRISPYLEKHMPNITFLCSLTELTMFSQHQTLPTLLTVLSMSRLPYSGICLKSRIFFPSLY